jgi:transcriptional regulator GlxA family with amidase domain
LSWVAHKKTRQLQGQLTPNGCATPIEHLQNVRIEHVKQLLESASLPVDEISAEAGYEDASFFRRLFRRRTELSPSQYRRMFHPINRG